MATNKLTNQVNNQSLIPSTDVIKLTLTLKMNNALVVETSVTVNNNSPIQGFVYPGENTQPTYDMTPGIEKNRIIYLMSKTREVFAQSSEPEANVKNAQQTKNTKQGKM